MGGPRPCPPGVILLLSAKGGDEARTTLLLRSGVKPDETRDARGYTALHIAAVHGHATIARSLINAGASTEAITPRDCLTPLRLAVDNGHLLAVQALLDAGANAAARDLVDRATPLHAAAEAGHIALVVELIRRGANLEAKAVSGQTPLRWALSLGRGGAATALLRSGADPNAPDRRGACCLHTIAGAKLEEGLGSPSGSLFAPAPCPSWSPAAMAELLLSAGADPDRGRRLDRPSPLEEACYHSNGDVGGGSDGGGGVGGNSGGSSGVGGRDVNGSTGGVVFGHERGSGGQASAGETPLHVAARESSVQVAEILLRSGANPNAKMCAEEGGLSPLHCAAAPGGDSRREMMKILLKAGADVNAVSGDGLTTPLRLSCMNAAVECVEELLRWGAHDVTCFPRPSPCLSASSPNSPLTSSSERSFLATAAPLAVLSCPSAGASAAAADTGSAPSLAVLHSDPPAHHPLLPSVGIVETAPGGNCDRVVPHALQRHPNVADGPRFRLPPLGDVVGSRVPLSARDVVDCRAIHQMLQRMPLDRAWRRRGWLVMLYIRAARVARCPCPRALQGGCSCCTLAVAPPAEFAGGEAQADEVANLSITFVTRGALADGILTRACSNQTRTGMHRVVDVCRGGLGAATLCRPTKRRAPDEIERASASSLVPVNKGTHLVACYCAAGVPNKDVENRYLSSDNELAKHPARAAKRLNLVAAVEAEETSRKLFRDLIDRLFNIQGDQSVFRKVLAWL